MCLLSTLDLPLLIISDFGGDPSIWGMEQTGSRQDPGASTNYGQKVS